MVLLISLTGVYALAAFRWLWSTREPTGAGHLHAIWLQAVELAALTVRITRA